MEPLIYTRERPGSIGRDARPRPASIQARIIRGLKQSAPFSSLQRRIIFFNLIGLAVLVLGMMYLEQFRSDLIDLRVRALHTQGEIIAITIAESAATGPGRTGYDPVRANVVLNRLAQPTGVRARLYDRRLRLTGDTRDLALSGAPITVTALAPPGEGAANTLLGRLEGVYRNFVALFRETPPLYTEVPAAGISRDREVREAALGRIVETIRVNSQGELIVSVAIPVRRFKEVLGVLVLSTQGQDINVIVQNERIVILQVFVIATLVSVALSVLLANTIANPIRRLAEAADPKGHHTNQPLDPARIEIPDLTTRADEIGDLSAALIRMTHALYRRIDAIETFAADVTHEIRNPLSSVRSAVETMELARTPEQKKQLLDIINKDVQRLDRLVTDIANASRLDAELVRERMVAFNLGDLITATAEAIHSQGEDRDVKVVTHLPIGPLIVRGLEVRIAQVVSNLLENALSFAPDGSTISITGIRAEPIIRITIEDQGPGIPDDNLESIFERFYSERPAAEAFGNHSGLGLSISKQIVEAHGGRIWAENIRPRNAGTDTPAEGARLILELPT